MIVHADQEVAKKVRGLVFASLITGEWQQQKRIGIKK
jgi:hypothetical protein